MRYVVQSYTSASSNLRAPSDCQRVVHLSRYRHSMTRRDQSITGRLHHRRFKGVRCDSIGKNSISTKLHIQCLNILKLALHISGNIECRSRGIIGCLSKRQLKDTCAVAAATPWTVRTLSLEIHVSRGSAWPTEESLDAYTKVISKECQYLRGMPS